MRSALGSSLMRATLVMLRACMAYLCSGVTIVDVGVAVAVEVSVVAADSLGIVVNVVSGVIA